MTARETLLRAAELLEDQAETLTYMMQSPIRDIAREATNDYNEMLAIAGEFRREAGA
jgi:hypothetical protein